MNNGKAMLGILVGVAIGATLGVLVAPRKGWRTRKFIKRRADDVADLVNEKIEEKIEDVMRRFDIPKCEGKETDNKYASVRKE